MQLRHAARIAFVLCGLLAAACEPEATPLPVILPTLSPAATTTPAPNEQALRYAITSNVMNFVSEEDQRLISESAEIIILDATPAPADLGSAYDVLVDFFEFPGAIEALVPMQVNLIVNTTRAPLDEPEIARIIGEWVAPEGDATTPEAIRAQLANAGYPDGFDLTLYSDVRFGTNEVGEFFNRINVDVRVVPTSQNAHLIITNVPSASENAAIFTTLIQFPIHYNLLPGANVSFTPAGFPIISR